MSRVYSSADLELIAATIGPCLEQRDHGEMLECIEGAAQSHRKNATTPPTPPAMERDQLTRLAVALRSAHQAFDDLDIGSHARLAYAGLGLKLPAPDELAALADVADAAAAGMPKVKRGPPPDPYDGFIAALARIVEHFAGWSRVYTYDDIEESYSGWFLDVVKACSAPLGIEKSDIAFIKAISRARERDKLPD